MGWRHLPASVPPRATATQARSKPNYVFPPDTAMALHPTQGFPALRALKCPNLLHPCSAGLLHSPASVVC